MKILASEQVQRWLGSLPPEARQKVRLELKKLASGKSGEVKSLERELEGYCRLRVGKYRVIYRYQTGDKGPECFCSFAESRDVVYEIFSAIVTTERGKI